MTYAITWEPGAVDHASRFLDDDADGLRALVDAVDLLAQEPRPGASVPFGVTGVRSLRVRRYRVIYEVDDGDRTVLVRHVARST